MSYEPQSSSPWIEISLDGILRNLDAVRSALPPGGTVIPVVKDCAYGCGANVISLFLEQHGIDCFAVARTAEARALRNSGLRSTVIVLGDPEDDDISWGEENDIVFSLNDAGVLPRWDRVNKRIRFHCNIDTGMGRLGLTDLEIKELVRQLPRYPNLVLEGFYSHFACADVPGTSSVSAQIERFEKNRALLRGLAATPPMIHLANSAAILRFAHKCFPAARAGISLYGCTPDPVQDFGHQPVPVVSLKGRVVKIKRIAAGESISYGWNYTADTATTIATVSIGYGCGLPRFLSGRGEVLVRGKRYRICGNVTMDYVMIDAGADPEIVVGDEAAAMGIQGTESITADDIARQGNTIGYEILCGLGTSIERRYYSGGRLHARQPGIFL